MNVACVSSDLVRELAVLERVVTKRPALPILSNVLLQASNGWLHMSVTDLEVGLVTACQATVAQDGEVTLPAKRLSDLIKTFPSTSTVGILQDKNAVRVTAEGFNSRLQALPAQDFPVIPTAEGTSATLPRAVLRDIIRKVRFAINEGDSRHLVRGALLTLPENGVGLVATDSHRLSLAFGTRTGPALEPVLLPTKCIDHVATLLADAGDGDIVFSHSDRHLFFELDGRLMVSRRMEGKFPNYERIIPQNEHKITLDRGALLTTINRQLLIDEVMNFIVEEGLLDITSASADIGDAIERLPAGYTGGKLEIKMKGEYVADFLTAATSPTITLELKDSRTPAMFTDGTYINVIMGMRS